jgi:hypothetical protein
MEVVEMSGHNQGGPEQIDPGKAGNAFLQGFAGCLGVGVAVAVVLVLIVVGCAAMAQHGGH